MIHITAAGPTTVASAVYGILIQSNMTLTGTITVTDNVGVQAIILNPGINQLRYYGFTGPVIVNPSGTCDITVSLLNKLGS